MKKSTMTALVNYLDDMIAMNGGEAHTEEFIVNARDEMTAELNKGAEKKAQNAEAYESIHDLLIGTLSETPVPFSEIFAALEADLPMGMTKGRVQYALTHLWQDEIVVVKGNPNTYRKA